MKKKTSPSVRPKAAVKRNPVAVIGLGYVGVTLAVTFADKGFPVIGIDVNKALVERLQNGVVPFVEPGLEEMMKSRKGRAIRYTDTIPPHEDPVSYIIAVSTNVLPSGKADHSHLASASKAIAKHLKKDDLILVRSTTTIGATRDVVLPILERTGLTVGKDFFLAFVPERTIEGKALEEIVFLPQIVGGATIYCTERASELFSAITKTIVPVDSLEEAELVKLMTNTYRDLSFAVANNLARIASEHAIDINTAIAAANYNYARNNIPLPSPGVGGYCLTKDPILLTAHSKSAHGLGELHREARRINAAMPSHTAMLIASFAKEAKLKNPRVLLAGLAFKGHPPTSDVRHSPSKDLIEALRARGFTKIQGFDAHVHDDVFPAWSIDKAATLAKGVASADIVIFMHKNETHGLAVLPRRVGTKKGLVMDPWRIMAKEAVLKKGWAYGTLSNVTLPQRPAKRR